MLLHIRSQQAFNESGQRQAPTLGVGLHRRLLGCRLFRHYNEPNAIYFGAIQLATIDAAVHFNRTNT